MRLLLVLALLLVPAVALSGVADTKLVTINDKTITLKDQIYFSIAKADIKKESYQLLDALAVALIADTHVTLVEIQVHTDARGNDDWNLTMSQKRADAIKTYLVGKGVDSKRLRAKGYGETKPIDKGTTEAAFAKNRRTELVILQRTK